MLGMAGSLGSASTAYIYDWNLAPVGQLLWLKELETYRSFPPMQDPSSYKPRSDHNGDEEREDCQSRWRVVVNEEEGACTNCTLHLSCTRNRATSNYLRAPEASQLQPKACQ
jgi:hypothetical protein